MAKEFDGDLAYLPRFSQLYCCRYRMHRNCLNAAPRAAKRSYTLIQLLLRQALFSLAAIGVKEAIMDRKKVVRYVLIAVGVLIVILLALPLFINANSFRPTIEEKLSAALGRKVQVGDLSLSIFSGSLTASNLSIAMTLPSVLRPS